MPRGVRQPEHPPSHLAAASGAQYDRSSRSYANTSYSKDPGGVA
jgi:hypothetical protein